jgi:caa(3)-type oxidase subunit IV
LVSDLIRTRTNLVWLVLVLATLISWALGTDHGFDRSGQHTASVAILLIAFIKVRLIGLYFMELKNAPTALRAAFEAYCVGVCAMTITMFLLG